MDRSTRVLFRDRTTHTKFAAAVTNVPRGRERAAACHPPTAHLAAGTNCCTVKSFTVPCGA